MKVKELIEYLIKCDSDATVFVRNVEYLDEGYEKSIERKFKIITASNHIVVETLFMNEIDEFSQDNIITKNFGLVNINVERC